jgi:hypothetical protein
MERRQNGAPSRTVSYVTTSTAHPVTSQEIIDVEEGKMMYLVVLDINGILVKKNNKHDNGGGWKVNHPHHNKKHNNDIIETRGAIFEIRPGAREFIRKCFEKYHVAIWSSTTFTNAQPIIDELFDHKNELVFRWFRDHTEYDPEYGIKADIKDFDTIKTINTIYSNAMFMRKWGPKNTIIIDDSHQKLRFNDEKNYIVIPDVPTINYIDVFNELEKKFTILSSGSSGSSGGSGGSGDIPKDDVILSSSEVVVID